MTLFEAIHTFPTAHYSKWRKFRNTLKILFLSKNNEIIEICDVNFYRLVAFTRILCLPDMRGFPGVPDELYEACVASGVLFLPIIICHTADFQWAINIFPVTSRTTRNINSLSILTEISRVWFAHLEDKPLHEKQLQPSSTVNHHSLRDEWPPGTVAVWLFTLRLTATKLCTR